ncbi:MAG: hypothetical protein ACK5MU_04100 [Candidatus Saccharimonadales bacterium]
MKTIKLEGEGTTLQFTRDGIILTMPDNEFSRTMVKPVEEQAPAAWKPDKGGAYFRVSSAGSIDGYVWRDDRDDNRLWDLGNCFETEGEAEAHREYLRAIAIIRRSSDFVPDWGDNHQEKVSIIYDNKENELVPSSCYYCQSQDHAHYRSASEARAALEIPEVKRAYEVVLGVAK